MKLTEKVPILLNRMQSLKENTKFQSKSFPCSPAQLCVRCQNDDATETMTELTHFPGVRLQFASQLVKVLMSLVLSDSQALRAAG